MLGENYNAALLQALGGQLARDLRISNNSQPDSSSSRSGNAVTSPAAADSSGSSKAIAGGGCTDEEAAHLLQQNETLRSTIAQLRQRLAQVLYYAMLYVLSYLYRVQFCAV
jgi:hypothetical protein